MFDVFYLANKMKKKERKKKGSVLKDISLRTLCLVNRPRWDHNNFFLISFLFCPTFLIDV